MIQSLLMDSRFSNKNEHNHLGNHEMWSNTMSTNDIEDNTGLEKKLQLSVCCYSELDCSKREEEVVIVSEGNSGDIIRIPILSLLSS